MSDLTRSDLIAKKIAEFQQLPADEEDEHDEQEESEPMPERPPPQDNIADPESDNDESIFGPVIYLTCD